MKKCVFCGGISEDKDHIPSKNLYKGITKNISPIKIPSCKKCNNGFSKDEVYFRDLIAILLNERSISATQLFEGSIKRSIKKTPALAMSMFKQMALVDYYSKGGIYLGKRTAMKITKSDHKRVFNVLDKYIKGLFYYQFQKVLPSDWIIKHFWLNPKMEAKLAHLIKTFNWRIVDENIFIYGYNFVPSTHQSIWCLVFFKKPLFFSFVLDSTTAKNH